MKKYNNEPWLFGIMCLGFGAGTALLISGLVRCDDTVADLGVIIWLLALGAELLVIAIENIKSNLKQ